MGRPLKGPRPRSSSWKLKQVAGLVRSQLHTTLDTSDLRLEEVGAGANGCVYRVHAATGDLAVKQTRHAKREARLQKKAGRDTAPEVLSSADGLICMQLRGGRPVGTEALAPPEALSMILAFIRALESLHGRGIRHRDLHAGNTLWDGKQATILDFGRASSSPLFHRRHTDTTALLSVFGNLSFSESTPLGHTVAAAVAHARTESKRKPAAAWREFVRAIKALHAQSAAGVDGSLPAAPTSVHALSTLGERLCASAGL